MQDLQYFRPDYVIQHDGNADRCRDAHRVVRNSLAIAQVLRHLLSGDLFDALSAIEHAETPEDGVSKMTSHDAASLAAVLEEVHRVLDASLDHEWRPQGPAAQAITIEAALPSTHGDGRDDRDRVFEITSEGHVTLTYPRISLPDLLERLPEVAAFLRRAAEQGNEVIVDD